MPLTPRQRLKALNDAQTYAAQCEGIARACDKLARNLIARADTLRIIAEELQNLLRQIKGAEPPPPHLATSQVPQIGERAARPPSTAPRRIAQAAARTRR